METKFREDDGLRFCNNSVIGIEKPDWTAGIPSDWIIFNEKAPSLDGTKEIRSCSVVSPVNIAMFAGDYTEELMHEPLCKRLFFAVVPIFSCTK